MRFFPNSAIVPTCRSSPPCLLQTSEKPLVSLMQVGRYARSTIAFPSSAEWRRAGRGKTVFSKYGNLRDFFPPPDHFRGHQHANLSTTSAPSRAASY